MNLWNFKIIDRRPGKKLCSLFLMVSLLLTGLLSTVPNVVIGGDPEAEISWDEAPFKKIFTLVEYKGELYAAGDPGEGGDGYIYKSSDGENWVQAFSNKTDKYWYSSGVFDDALYFGSREGSTDNWVATIWRSTDGSTLEKVYEDTNSSTVIPCSFWEFDGYFYTGISNRGNILRTSNGDDWNEVFTNETYTRIGYFHDYKGMLYATAYSAYDGGAVFRSLDGENWEITNTWTGGSERSHSTPFILEVYQDELYVSLLGDLEETRIEVFKSSDGENFTEVWNSTTSNLDSPRLTAFNHTLYLTISGEHNHPSYGEIWFYDGETFRQLLDGEDDTKFYFGASAVLNGNLYIGGGTSVYDENNGGYVYCISDTVWLTITTTRPTYLLGDTVTLNARYSEGKTEVTFQVKDPDGDTVLIETVESNLLGEATVQFKLLDDDLEGVWTVYVSNSGDEVTNTTTFEVQVPPVLKLLPFDFPVSVAAGDTLELEFEIMNTYEDSQDVTLVLQLKDPDLRYIRPAIDDVTVPSGGTTGFTLSVDIPADAQTGSYFIQGQMLTGLPEDGGRVLAFESSTILVT